jgi:tetratricopeptide (TPR) repeat protein
MLRAEFLIVAGRPQEAISGLQKVIDRRPEDLELSFALAQDYLRMGRPAAAQAALEHAAAFCSTPQQRARLFSLRGSISEGESMTAKALEDYEAASRVAPEAPDLHLQVARALETLHRYTDAEAEVHAAIRLQPGLASSQHSWLTRLEDEDRRAREWAVEQILQAPDGGR